MEQELHVLSGNTGNKDGASSTTFTDHIAIPVFLELDFMGFAMLLLERTFWILTLVGSFTALAPYCLQGRPSATAFILVSFGKGLDGHILRSNQMVDCRL